MPSRTYLGGGGGGRAAEGVHRRQVLRLGGGRRATPGAGVVVSGESLKHFPGHRGAPVTTLRSPGSQGYGRVEGAISPEWTGHVPKVRCAGKLSSGSESCAGFDARTLRERPGPLRAAAVPPESPTCVGFTGGDAGIAPRPETRRSVRASDPVPILSGRPKS